MSGERDIDWLLCGSPVATLGFLMVSVLILLNGIGVIGATGAAYGLSVLFLRYPEKKH